MSSIAGLGIRSFAHRLFAHLLISLKSNEQLWAIRSDPSRQMSNHEQIAQGRSEEMSHRERIPQVAQENEWPWAIRSGCSEEMSKWAIHSKKFGQKNLKSYLKFKKKIKQMRETLFFAHFLFFGERCE